MPTGRRERLSQDDARILRLESPVIKGHTGKVLIIAPGSDGRALSVERLRDQVGERMGAFPRLSQRVEEPRLGLGRPAWVESSEVDLAGQAPATEAREARVLVSLPAALRRELRRGRDTRLDQHIGPAREVAWTSFPLERLKRIGHGAAERVTVNDVVLAVVAGG